VKDTDNINSEFNDFNNLIKEKNSTNVFYESSIRYSNIKVIDFVEKLKADGIYDEQLIVITSDHGTSYLGEIYRESKVCTMYDENYKTPLIFLGKDIKGKVCNNYGSAIDIIPTILELNDDDFTCYNLDGKSILKEERDFITLE
ncbi:sulfatase-like hydrolase/transferase, partial [Clostridium perfringens]